MRRWLSNLYFSFPFQLLVLHLRSNLLLLFMWILVGLMMSGSVGRKLGLQYLFLDPEYLGQVGFWSFFFLGFTLGGFIMSWNLTIYLLSAYLFPFLASLSRPFTKFCLNNFLLPAAFLLIYFGIVISFQTYYEGLSFSVILLNILGCLLGLFCTVLFYALYFRLTNRDISYYQSNRATPPNLSKSIAPGRRDIDLDYIKLDQNRWKVRTYLNENFRPRLVRSVAHYEPRMLMNIFRQNHLNALITQLMSMMILLALGYLIDFQVFQIPAAASFFILLSILTAIIGAVTYWFNEWRITIIILLLVAVNYFTSFNMFNHRNKAYGLQYQDSVATYSYKTLQKMCLADQVEKDKQETIKILDTWKEKYMASTEEKPKMVILCTSGGGLKAATWGMNVVKTADSLSNGKLMPQTVLITGASGGLVGISYLRELYLRQQLNEIENWRDQKYIDNIAKDLLNPIIFTIVSNDLFLPWSKFQYGGYSYHKDRGYIFEEQLSKNTDGILDKPLKDYLQHEREALIPMLYITPSIVNDARRLVISPHGVSFMMIPPVGVEHQNTVEVDAVDYGWMFRDQGAYDLRFLTALRMNSTYPYILPNVHLPSNPEIEVMDAGFLDNYGILSATRFIQVFRQWILDNTSGVILVQISSSEKIESIQASDRRGIIRSFFNPLGIAGKVMAKQEFEHDTNLGFIFDLLGQDKFEVVRFIYRPSEENKLEASISFHMTGKEKQDVRNAIFLEANQSSLRKLIDGL